MIALLQRVASAEVQVDKKLIAKIGTGLMVLLGICTLDDEQDVIWLANKIASMRVFADSDGKMNLDIAEVKGEILLVSQFTLHALTKKGNIARSAIIGSLNLISTCLTLCFGNFYLSTITYCNRF